MSILHGQHNKKACDFLLESGEFNDWVITTAFYSALHYLESELFPLSLTNNSGRTNNYHSFDEYCSENQNYRSKHRLRRSLIEEHLPEISIEYNTLMDLCWTARYSNYQHEKETAEWAKQNLEQIISFIE